MINKVRKIIKRYPITRGILTYSVLYPCSNFTQQSLDPHREKINYNEVLRFAFFGSCVVAPTLYGWIKIASVLVKGNSLKHAISKVSIFDLFFHFIKQF